jgi:hypothetical protein
MGDEEEQITTAQRSQISREYLLLRQRIIITITLSTHNAPRQGFFIKSSGGRRTKESEHALTHSQLAQHTEISPSEKTD